MGKSSTSFKPGHKGGRPQGKENKITRTVKETVLRVFNERERNPETSLAQFAIDYPRDFYAVAAKLIPTELQATVKTIIIVSEDE